MNTKLKQIYRSVTGGSFNRVLQTGEKWEVQQKEQLDGLVVVHTEAITGDKTEYHFQRKENGTVVMENPRRTSSDQLGRALTEAGYTVEVNLIQTTPDDSSLEVSAACAYRNNDGRCDYQLYL